MPFPFDVSFDELRSELDTYVDVVFGCLDSRPVNVGNIVENVLCQAGISHRRTKLGERLDPFCQAPDFVIPKASSPQVVIEAKHADDDGSARDKITRIEYLAAVSMDGQPRFEVVACISGIGFGVRRKDMRALLLATRGKIFTPQHMPNLVAHTRLAAFRSSSDSG